MRVLQLGKTNWQDTYQIPEKIDWYFNDFHVEKESKSSKNYDVVLITGQTNLSKRQLDQLSKLVPPYHVLYDRNVIGKLNASEQLFLKQMAAQEIKEDLQYLINKLPVRYFSGQSGIRIFPTEFKLNERIVNNYEFKDKGHLNVSLDTHDQWISLGTYKSNLFIDPNRLINLWLSMKNEYFKVRLKLFVRKAGYDGDVKDNRVIDLTNFQKEEYFAKIDSDEASRNAALSIEVRGKGDLTLGILHSRWGRDGAGNFIAGGQRIVNPESRDDIAYYFNPGDLKPPLNVYFSGARGLEGFEAYYLFKKQKAPMLLFTDMRLEIGQFYDDSDKFFEKRIIKTIKNKLVELGFDESQLIMNGISMGTYPALKYGAKMGAHAINVAKPITNLGYIASRMALDRPDEFDTIFDIDNQIDGSIESENLKKQDQKFWQEFNKQDLSNTRIFAGYMKNDDYDDQAVKMLRDCNAVKNALQFSAKGFAGRHNDDPQVTFWFIDRLNDILKEDFGR